MTPTTELVARLPFPPLIADRVKDAVGTSFGSILGGVPPTLLNDSPIEGHQGVVSIISFMGDKSWTMTLALPADSSERFALKFAGFEIPFESTDMGDLVGELANVLAGEVSARLDASGIKARMSLPTVARGTDVQILLPECNPTLRLSYQSIAGKFWLILATAWEGLHFCRRPGT